MIRLTAEHRFSLPDTVKIKKASEFQTVFQDGKSRAGKYLVVYVLRRGDTNQSRAAFAAGKKLGKANVRNRLKRMMREVWRMNRYKVMPGFDLLFMARKAAIAEKTQMVDQCFLNIARQMSLLKNNGEK